MANLAPSQQPSAPPSAADERPRLNLSLSPELDRLLASVADLAGTTKTSIAAQLITQGLPELLERAQGLRKAARDIEQQARRK
jgi:hypothetical protein